MGPVYKLKREQVIDMHGDLLAGIFEKEGYYCYRFFAHFIY